VGREKGNCFTSFFLRGRTQFVGEGNRNSVGRLVAEANLLEKSSNRPTCEKGEFPKPDLVG